VALGAVGGLTLWLNPFLGPAYEAVLDRLRGTREVAPARAEAPGARPGHGEELLWDGHPNTYWSPPGGGKGATVEFPLKEPTRLVYLKVFPGVSAKDKELWSDTGRPRRIQAVLLTSDDRKVPKTLVFDNAMGDVDFNVATSDVTTVRLTITRVWGGTTPSRGTAIGEVEFYARK